MYILCNLYDLYIPYLSISYNTNCLISGAQPISGASQRSLIHSEGWGGGWDPSEMTFLKAEMLHQLRGPSVQGIGAETVTPPLLGDPLSRSENLGDLPGPAVGIPGSPSRDHTFRGHKPSHPGPASCPVLDTCSVLGELYFLATSYPSAYAARGSVYKFVDPSR